MIAATHARLQKLTAFAARFEEATAAHDAALAMAQHAQALDLALESEAAQHGIEFDEIVREFLKQSGCQ